MTRYQDLSNLIWKTADDVLRGLFRPHEYGDVILPFVVLRRLDSVLEPRKEEVVRLWNEWKGKVDDPSPIITSETGLIFYNYSKYDLKRLTEDHTNLRRNLDLYLGSFSPNVLELVVNFQVDKPIEKLSKNNRLFLFLEKFTEIDLRPQVVDNHTMGQVFEELLRRFSEMSNETSGEHYTPRDVVRLLVSVLFSPDKDSLLGEGLIRSVYDPCCGTGGMLTISEEWVHDNLNPDVRLRLLGQELNPQSYSICRGEFLVVGKDPNNIRLGSSLSEDRFVGEHFDYLITNPPYGVSWKSDQVFVERESTNPLGRFSVGTPRSSDGQLLFLQHLISKMDTDRGSRIGVVFNGSPLTTGDAGGGESEIRKWIIENDWLECVVRLPDELFFNTKLQTYLWIVTNRKSPEREGTIQLIDASTFWEPLRRPLGEKRKFISIDLGSQIVEEYLGFQNSEHSRLFSNQHFGYRTVVVERPTFDENGDVVRNRNGKPVPDKSKSTVEKIPLLESSTDYLSRELGESNGTYWIDESKIKVGYEIHFTRIFYRIQRPRSVGVILQEITDLDRESEDFFERISNVVQTSSRRELVDSLQDWLGEVPDDWKLTRLGNVFDERTEEVNDSDYPPLSVTKEGVVPQLESVAKTDNRGSRGLVRKGDFVINSRSARRGAGGVVNEDGSVSPVYLVLTPNGIKPSYTHYLLRSQVFGEEFYRLGKGIHDDLWSTRFSDMKNIVLPVPDESEQDDVEKFLRWVEKNVSNQKRRVTLLEELRDSILSGVVTGKIDVRGQSIP